MCRGGRDRESGAIRRNSSQCGFRALFFCANISSRGKRMKIDRLNYEFGKLRSIFAALAVLALVLCSAFSARAQVTTAAVRGTVTDEQGAAIAGADVTITNVETSFNRATTTGSDGVYNFPDLPL